MKATRGMVAAVALVASAAIAGCAVETTTTECMDDGCVAAEVQGDIPQLPDGRLADLQDWVAGLADGNIGACDAYFAKMVAQAAEQTGLETCQEARINEAELWEELTMISCTEEGPLEAVAVPPPYEAEMAPPARPDAVAIPHDGTRPPADATVTVTAVAHEPLTMHEWAWVRLGVDLVHGNELTRMQQTMLDTPLEIGPTVVPPGCEHVR